MEVLERLSNRVVKIETTVTAIATAKPGQTFGANTMHITLSLTAALSNILMFVLR